MSPEIERKFAEMQNEISQLKTQLKQFRNASELDPEIQRTILNVVGALNTLDSLSDVVLSSPTNGQVLKFNGTNWVNNTDLT